MKVLQNLVILSIKTHVKSIHEGIRYPCKICDKSFTKSFYLKEHVKSIHKAYV